jgi:spore maturation protein CgeB
MRIVILGLSITSSWGNGHATTYRSLASGLAKRGHRVQFLERDVPWYAPHRDLRQPEYCHVDLYSSVDELERVHAGAIRAADLVMVGSFVPEGRAVTALVHRLARGCTAFYDIDTPRTLAALEADTSEYLERRQVPGFDLYLSFTGGPSLERLEQRFGAVCARPLYCSADPSLYRPDDALEPSHDLGYLGTYSPDRQPSLDELFLAPAAACPAQRFILAGAQYPESLDLPLNVEHIEHLDPGVHRRFYTQQRFTLNLTRTDMIAAGYSPSVRLFEAAACGTPIISDVWAGIDTLFQPGTEIVLARTRRDVIDVLHDMPANERCLLGARARQRVLTAHTSEHRALELEEYVASRARIGTHAGKTSTTSLEPQ